MLLHPPDRSLSETPKSSPAQSKGGSARAASAYRSDSEPEGSGVGFDEFAQMSFNAALDRYGCTRREREIRLGCCSVMLCALCATLRTRIRT